jgi:leucyl-tRNA synthetase
MKNTGDLALKQKMIYNPQKIERKWQKLWKESGIYKTPDEVKGKKNFYHLVMFPYPSGDLHIGHWYNFGPGDVYARLKRMQGFNVMSPIGFDAFGLPAENAAIQRKIHPKIWTYKNIDRMRKQLKTIGTCYDWSKEVITCDPNYYKWTQWMFLQFFKKGLAYRAKVPANFCPSCKTVLANEQVVEGKCERCEAEVIQEEIEQWLFKITAYAEELLKDLEKIDWPETTKIMQKNWIGKSEGAEIRFQIKDFSFQIPVFTTRADTLFGCTYLVLSPEYPLIKDLESKIENLESVQRYIERAKKKTERERISEIKEKAGVEIQGIKAINPVNDREIPIFVADYVLIYYGTGAIMGVPAHDQRDFDFAKKYNLSVIEVIKPIKEPEKPLEKPPLVISGDQEIAYAGEGILINSGRFNGLSSERAKERIVEWLAKEKQAQKAICYRLKDWLISRQRYWGAPIPMIFCKKCASTDSSAQAGWQPVPEKDLPVLLPDIKDFRPTGEGKSPLAKSKNFVETNCPKCQEPAQRETDTMDTFVCSSWYYFRYTDPQNEREFASKEKMKKWLPVNMYIGGQEHAVMHLLYSRFFTKVLRDLGYIDFPEPFLKLRHQGMILGEDGQKMSKSRGNVVDPDKQVKKYGSDVARMYLCFMGPYSQGGPWNPRGITGIYRFLEKVWNLIAKNSKSQFPMTKQFRNSNDQNSKLEKLLHKTIKKVTEDIENLRFNTAISALMILVNQLTASPKKKSKTSNGAGSKQLTVNHLRALLLLLSPFAPHLTEELWQQYIVHSSEFNVQRSIHNQSWPKYDPKLVKEEKITLIVQINGKVRDKIEVEADVSEEKAKKLALSQEKIKKWIGDKEIKKVIFVPGKLVNIVV